MRILTLVTLAVLLAAATWLFFPSAAESAGGHATRGAATVDAGDSGTGVTLEPAARAAPRAGVADAHVAGTTEPVGVTVVGRVVDSRGRPHAGLNLEVRFPKPRPLNSNVAKGTTTGPDGTFRVDGMLELDEIAHAYKVYHSGSNGLGDHLIGRIDREQLDAPVVLTYDYDYIVVRWTGPKLECGHFPPRSQLSVYLADAGPIGGVARPRPERLRSASVARRADGADVVFRPEAGRQYAVAAYGDSLRSQVKFVAFPKGAGRLEVSLSGDVSGAPGLIELSVVGGAVQGEWDSLRYWLEDPKTGFPFHTGRLSADAHVASMAAPPGTYRVVVGSYASSEDGSAEVFGLADTVVGVESGGRVEATLALPGQGTLEIDVAGSSREADCELTLCGGVGAHVPHAPIRVWLESATGAHVARAIPTSTMQSDGTVVLPEVDVPPAPPAPIPSRALHSGAALKLNLGDLEYSAPAGSWVVNAELLGGRRVSQRVDLQSGETVTVTLNFGQ